MSSTFPLTGQSKKIRTSNSPKSKSYTFPLQQSCERNGVSRRIPQLPSPLSLDSLPLTLESGSQDQEIQRLKEENILLKERNTALAHVIRSNQDSLNQLAHSYDLFTKGYYLLKKKNDSLCAQNEQLLQQYQILEQRSTLLTQLYNDKTLLLEAAIEGQEKTLSKLKTNYEETLKKNDSLEKQRDSYFFETKKLEKKVEKLSEKLEKKTESLLLKDMELLAEREFSKRQNIYKS